MRRKMERKEMVALSTVGFLGLLSAVLGFAAEATRIKDAEVQRTLSDCIYPPSNAAPCALSAALVLILARIVIIMLMGCPCCKKVRDPSVATCTYAMACLVVSWFAFVIAQVIFMIGALVDNQHDDVPMIFGWYYYCSVVERGVFTIAATSSLVSVILGIAYAYALISVKSSDTSSVNSEYQSGIVMGQPRKSTQAPVFVHEDTYIRRQFT